MCLKMNRCRNRLIHIDIAWSNIRKESNHLVLALMSLFHHGFCLDNLNLVQPLVAERSR